MPIYEFKCDKCGFRFDKIQKVDDAPPKCVKCESETQKLISASSFSINGGGVYKPGFSSKKIGDT